MMRAFLSLVLVLVLAVPAVATERVDLELVLAADGSGSIDDEEFRLQRQGYAAAVLHPEVLAEGITINALMVKTPGGGFRGPVGMSLDQHYKLDVIGGPGAFVKLAETRASFAEAILAKMLLEISGLPAPAMLAFSERDGTHDP